MKKKLACCLFAFLVTISFSGCNYRQQDIRKITVVQGIGIDYDDSTKDYNVSLQIFDIAQSSGMGESESGNLTRVLKFSGNSVSSALDKITVEIGKSLILSHNKVIVLSEEVMNNSVTSVMDYFLREYSNRANVSVVMADGCKASDIIEADQGNVSFPARELENLLEAGRINGYTEDISVADLTELEEDDSSAAYIPTVKIKKEDDAKKEDGAKYTQLSGFAVIKNDKLAGKLSLSEGRGLLFVNDEIEGGTFNVDDEKFGTTTLKIIESDTKIETKVSDDAKFTVNITCVADVMEISAKTDSNITESDSNRLSKEAGEHIEKTVKKVITTCLDDYNADVFGFARRVWILYPSFYRQNEEIFETKPNSKDVQINVDFKVRRMGQGNT